MKTSKMAKKPVDTELCARFAEVFNDSGLEQGVFGKSVGQSQSAVSDIIRGRKEPSKATLKAIITKYDISGDWLTTGQGPKRRSDAYGFQVAEPEPLRMKEEWEKKGLPWEVRAAIQKAVQMVDDQIRIIPFAKRRDDPITKGVIVETLVDLQITGQQEKIVDLLAEVIRAFSAPVESP